MAKKICWSEKDSSSSENNADKSDSTPNNKSVSQFKEKTSIFYIINKTRKIDKILNKLKDLKPTGVILHLNDYWFIHLEKEISL